jgi:hypothetical protein
MKRRRIYGRHRLSRDAERLAWLAQGLADSGSRLEDAWLESEISGLIDRCSRPATRMPSIRPWTGCTKPTAGPTTNSPISSRRAARSARSGEGGNRIARLLDRPAGAGLVALCHPHPERAQETARCPACPAFRPRPGAEARVHFADYLFSPDQLPQGYAETRAFAEDLWNAAAAGRDMKVDSASPAGKPVVRLRRALPDGRRPGAGGPTGVPLERGRRRPPGLPRRLARTGRPEFPGPAHRLRLRSPAAGRLLRRLAPGRPGHPALRPEGRRGVPENPVQRTGQPHPRRGRALLRTLAGGMAHRLHPGSIPTTWCTA